MSAAPTPMLGRRYELKILGPASQGSQAVYTISNQDFTEPESLRITFNIQTVWFQWYWIAEICIYNPNEQFSDFLLSQGTSAGTKTVNAGNQQQPVQQGMQVVLSAGYQKGGKYGEIWNGFVLQPMFERLNQVDFKVTLNCIIGLDEVSRNSLGATYKSGMSQLQIVQNMASSCFHPIGTQTLASGLSNKSLPRAKTVFGNPAKYFSEIARDNGMQWWLESKGLLNMGDLNKTLPTTAQVYTPTTGIIGTPQQTQLGVNMRLLLDPTVQVKNPPMAVRIDNTIIRQLVKQVGDLSSASILSQDGTYIVVGANYLGDTRGQEWYVDVIGWLTANEKLAAISAATGVALDRS